MNNEHIILLEKTWRKYARKLLKAEENKLLKESKRKKLNPASLPGLDRVKISIPRELIRKKQGCSHNIDNLNFSDSLFSKLKSGEVQGNYYCHLDVNLPKVLTGDNISNVRTKQAFNKVLDTLQDRLSSFYNLDINLRECHLITAEINKNFALQKDFTEYQGAMFICAYEVINKKFKPMTPFIEPFSGIRGGKKNKKVRLYDKTYERVCSELSEYEWFQNMTKSEIIEVARNYQSEARLEFFMNKEALWNIIPKEINLRDLSKDIEDILDNSYDLLLSQLGLDTNTFEKRKKLKLKRLKTSFKQQKRMHEGNFISKFIAHERELWGLEQVSEIINDLITNRNTIKSATWRAKQHFERVGKRFGIKQDNWKELHEIIGKMQ